ncbi:MAG: response regulator [Flavobacterium sp.]|nr:MAG: response regulator [Flavobacterium sp.]
MKKQYLLLIDDDPDEFVFLLSAGSKVPGLFEYSYAVSADAAFAMFDDFRPDYILMDMNMPIVNGLECVRRIKSSDGLSKIPVFIYTTGFDETLKKKALNIGASGCVRKPTQPRALVSMLENLHSRGTL